MFIENVEFIELNGDYFKKYSPLVSVYCVTYNHIKYIKNCLDGLLSQRTTFNYEILVFDDASTDGTSDIVKEYANKYPNIIHAFIAKNNTYLNLNRSKIRNSLIKNYMKGKFVAICEGDDCWVDPNKLQLQADFLLCNPNYILVLHNGYQLNNTTLNKKLMINDSCNKELTTSEIIYQKGMWPTASVFVTKDMMLSPKILGYGFGDWPLQLYASLVGKVYYFAKPMCIYNYLVEGSWSNRTFYSTKNHLRYAINYLRLLDTFNIDSHYKYELYIKQKKSRFLVTLIKLFEINDAEYSKLCDQVIKDLQFQSISYISEISNARKRYLHSEYSDHTCWDNIYESRIKGKFVYIFSASTAGKQVLRMYKNHNIVVKGFLDNDTNKQNQLFEGLPVYSLLDFIKLLNQDYVIQVASDYYDDEICAQLKKYGLKYISAKELFDLYFM